MKKRLFRWLMGVGCVLAVLVAGNGDYRPTPLDLALSPYRYSLVGWELSNFLDKWTRKAGQLLPWRSQETRGPRNALAQEFFALGRELGDLERHLHDPVTQPGDQISGEEAAFLQSEIQGVQERRRMLRPQVEEAVESEISAVLAAEGFASRIGLIFPPVDTVFASSPGVLILSPRDRIHRERTILLAHHGQLSAGQTVEEACVLALFFERAARLQLLARAAGEIRPIKPELGREAHDYRLNPKPIGATFHYLARQVLKTESDCLS